jgi:hypothetical protein
VPAWLDTMANRIRRFLAEHTGEIDTTADGHGDV